jgi:D-lyxose ketol-isomerase
MKKSFFNVLGVTAVLLSSASYAASYTRITSANNELTPITFTSANKSDDITAENATLKILTVMVEVNHVDPNSNLNVSDDEGEHTLSHGSSITLPLNPGETLKMHSADDNPSSGSYQYNT